MPANYGPQGKRTSIGHHLRAGVALIIAAISGLANLTSVIQAARSVLAWLAHLRLP